MKELDITKHWNDLNTIVSYLGNNFDAFHAIIIQWAFGCKWKIKKYPDGTYYYRGYPIYKNKNVVKDKELLRYKWFAGYGDGVNSIRIRANTLNGIKSIIDQHYSTYAYFMARKILTEDKTQIGNFIVHLLTEMLPYPVYDVFRHKPKAEQNTCD